MKLKELVEQYGEYEVSASFQFGSSEGIQIRLEPPKPKTNTVWELKDGDPHYWIDGVGKVKECGVWSNESYDPMARDVGNVFLTKEEAEKEIERRKVETLLLKHGGRRRFKEDGNNFYLVREGYSFETYQEHWIRHLGAIYFDTEEQARNAVNEIGEERITEALFDCRW